MFIVSAVIMFQCNCENQLESAENHIFYLQVIILHLKCLYEFIPVI